MLTREDIFKHVKKNTVHRLIIRGGNTQTMLL